MRRIYESDAVSRDDDDPFSPGRERDRSTRPQAMRWIDSTAWSRRLIPAWVRHRALSVSISTPRTEVPVGDPVHFTVTLRNALPVPLTVRTASPLLWQWDVDGHPEASHLEDAWNGDDSEWRFDRGERKRFSRRWQGMFRVAADEWRPAEAGEYAIGAGLTVDGAEEKGLYDRTTVRLVD